MKLTGPDLRQKSEEAAAALPALIAHAEKAVGSVLHGAHNQRKPGTGDKFWQFREYSSYDQPQDIDWRQSAKNDRVYIRQKEWQTTQTTLFWCCQSKGMEFASKNAHCSKIEAARIITLATAILIARAGEQVGISGGSQTGRSDIAIERIGNALLYENHGGEPADLVKNNTLFQAGDFLEPIEIIEERFKKLAAQIDSSLVVQILDPDEIELPYKGRAIFEDPGNNNREIIDNVSSVRAQYRQRIERHIQNVESLCRQHEWGYILHRTDMPVEDALAQIWAIFNEKGVRI